jgi:hypothetical protein
LENLDDDNDGDVDIRSVSVRVRENIKFSPADDLGYYELKELKTSFDRECSELLE